MLPSPKVSDQLLLRDHLLATLEDKHPYIAQNRSISGRQTEKIFPIASSYSLVPFSHNRMKSLSFLCEFCGIELKKMHKLSEHVQKFHSLPPKIETYSREDKIFHPEHEYSFNCQGKNYQPGKNCQDCGKTFSSLYEYTNHKRSKHP